MKMNMAKELAALDRLTVTQLRQKHIEVFGEATRSGNKDWLRKRIAWRLQANAHGGWPGAFVSKSEVATSATTPRGQAKS